MDENIVQTRGQSSALTEQELIDWLDGYGIEIIDTKTIRYDGHNYKLLEYDSTNKVFVESEND